jgi:hypothetical protein
MCPFNQYVRCVSVTNRTQTSIESVIGQLQHMIDHAFQQETINDQALMDHLHRVLQDEDGFRIVDNQLRALTEHESMNMPYVDGSGDIFDETSLGPVYSNMSVVTFTMVSKLLTRSSFDID